jgi:hypothetical protein
MCVISLAIQHVHRHHDDAGLDARQPQIDDLDAIGEIERQPIAGLHAARPQRMRHAVAPLLERAEGQRQGCAGRVDTVECGRRCTSEQRAVV